MELEAKGNTLQNKVHVLKDKCTDLEGRSLRQIICQVEIEEGMEKTNPTFVADVLKEILNLLESQFLDQVHRILAPRPPDGETICYSPLSWGREGQRTPSGQPTKRYGSGTKGSSSFQISLLMWLKYVRYGLCFPLRLADYIPRQSTATAMPFVC